MPDFRSKSPMDCVPLALSNFFNLPYDEVATAVGYIPGKGSPHSKTTDFLKSHGMVEIPIPRRGQEKMNGIIKTCSKGSKFHAGHVVVVRHGIVFDSIAPDGLPIAEWKARINNNRICEYWKLARPTASTSSTSKPSVSTTVEHETSETQTWDDIEKFF